MKSKNGRHNTKNAAATIAQIFNLSNSHIKKCLQTFKGVSHRLEHVINILKVEYINDSKATNVEVLHYFCFAHPQTFSLLMHNYILRH